MFLDGNIGAVEAITNMQGFPPVSCSKVKLLML